MSDEKDYSREDQAAIKSVQKRLDRQEQLAEASKEMIKKFAKDVFKDKKTRNAIARDCIERIQGREPSNDLRKLAGRDGARVPASIIDEPLPTGYDKFPWQEDGEDE
jgi:hypothetical protein